VWILGHVLSGWDGTNPLQNPTNLCRFYTILSSLLSTKVDCFHASLSNVGALTDIYAIGFNCSVSVDRFSPHVIASTSMPAFDDTTAHFKTDIFFGHTHEDQISVRTLPGCMRLI
jgi:hypothetical protein